MRVAAIDLGSNSCVFLVLEGPVQQVLATDLAFCRLGEGLDETGRLQPQGIERSLDALKGFTERARDLGCDRIECVGTAALREGSNRQELIDRAAEFGLRVRAITGEEEALLSARAALDHLPPTQQALVVDVGGASTEFILAQSGGDIVWRRSLPIGSVRLVERAGLFAPAQDAAWSAVVSDIGEALESLPHCPSVPVVAVAGTATTLVMCLKGMATYESSQVDQVEVSVAAMDGLLEDLKALDLEQRILAYHLPRARADVFPVGITLLSQVLKRQQTGHLTVRDRGVSWGLAQTLLAQEERLLPNR